MQRTCYAAWCSVMQRACSNPPPSPLSASVPREHVFDNPRRIRPRILPRVCAGDSRNVIHGPHVVHALRRDDRGHRLLLRVCCGELLRWRLYGLQCAVHALPTGLRVPRGLSRCIRVLPMPFRHSCAQWRVRGLRRGLVQPQRWRSPVHPLRPRRSCLCACDGGKGWRSLRLCLRQRLLEHAPPLPPSL